MILITGGAGYIGSHTCVELLNSGYDIVVMDNLSNAQIESIHRIKRITGKDFPFYQTDMLDHAGVERIFQENNIDAVIHFAGFKAVGESVAKPLMYYHNNITGTLTLCDVMRQYNVKKIVFSSSATVYGNPKSVPLHEDADLSTTNPYGSTKLFIEQILRDLYTSDHDWSIALLRYFNPIGAHASGLIGESPNGIPNNLVPYIAKVACGQLEKVHVYGNDYPTPDGTGVRDYIHVVDLSLGHVKAVEKILSSTGIDAYNLGTGNGYSVLQVIHAYEKACGKPIAYEIDPRRPGDIATSYACCDKAKNILGWQAQRNIDDMCKDSWNFTLKNPKGY